MKLPDDQFQKLLGYNSIQEIKRTLLSRGLTPSLSQASKLREHIQSLPGELKPVRLGVVHTYTSELLDPWLHVAATLNRLTLQIYHAPYGVTLQEADESSGLVAHAPDVTLLLLTREDLHTRLRLPAGCIRPTDRSGLLEEIRIRVSTLVRRFREHVSGRIIFTLLPHDEPPALGLYDAMTEHSELQWWHQVKSGLSAELRQIDGVTFLDLDLQMQQVGRQHFFDRRLWYSSAFPYSPDGAFALANAVTSVAATLHLTRAKVIVVDADNTLWGGVVGEDGINGIALGPDYPGRSFVDFQKRLLGLQQRGFLLALCSKNNPEDVQEVLESHPHQILKNEHFSAQRVNWQPKADNLMSISKELNLGLDSFIFVDDSDYECSAVSHALQEVDVIQVPNKPIEVPFCLDSVARLEIVSLTAEDLDKTAMYAQERLRKSQLEKLTEIGGSIEDYLISLNMRMSIGLDDPSMVPRLAQLTQKTNQFNLTTRRYTEEAIAGMIASDAFSVYHFSLSDEFGSSGVVGLAIIERLTNEAARIDTFLMSCRVIGRRAEDAFLHSILASLKSASIADVRANYIPTRKNALAEHFLPNFGFSLTNDGDYHLDLSNDLLFSSKRFPITIEGP